MPVYVLVACPPFFALVEDSGDRRFYEEISKFAHYYKEISAASSMYLAGVERKEEIWRMKIYVNIYMYRERDLFEYVPLHWLDRLHDSNQAIYYAFWYLHTCWYA